MAVHLQVAALVTRLSFQYKAYCFKKNTVELQLLSVEMGFRTSYRVIQLAINSDEVDIAVVLEIDNSLALVCLEQWPFFVSRNWLSNNVFESSLKPSIARYSNWTITNNSYSGNRFGLWSLVSVHLWKSLQSYKVYPHMHPILSPFHSVTNTSFAGCPANGGSKSDIASVSEESNERFLYCPMHGCRKY